MLDEQNVSGKIRRRETKIDMLEEELRLKNEVHESVVECMKEKQQCNKFVCLWDWFDVRPTCQ